MQYRPARPSAARRSATSGASIAPGATISTACPERSGARRPAFIRTGSARQRDREPEGRALPGRAVQRDAAAHALDDAPRDREAEPGAAEFARHAAVGLLEFLEHARLRFGRNADAGVAHRELDFVRRGARLDDDRNAARLGEFHGVAGEIEQHLTQPRRIADHHAGQPVVDRRCDLQPLGLRARAEQLDRFLDQRDER